MIMTEAGNELDQSLKGLAALLCTATPPDATAIREEVLRAIVAANLVELERETMVEAVESLAESNDRAFARIEIMGLQRGSLMGLIKALSDIAEEAVATYSVNAHLPHMKDALSRYLLERTVEIGTRSREVYETYQAIINQGTPEVGNGNN